MGCICSKGAEAHEHGEAPRRSQSLKRLVSSSKREEVVVADIDASIRNDGSTTRLIRKPEESVVSPTPALPDEVEKKVAVVVDGPRKSNGHQRRSTTDARPNGLVPELTIVDAGKDEQPNIRLSDVPNGFEGEHVAAGWPAWLTAVAGEAVRGWLPRRADSFERLNKIGQGTYSNVYKARDLKTGKIVALKKVRFVNLDPDSVRFMAREIHILRRLDHPNIVKLEGLITSRMSGSLYLVFEYMEHDLAGLGATPGIKFTEPQVKCYMKQLLCGLEHCHSRRVLHRDIKGSNLLIDNNGILKIADFGLATFFNPDKQQPLTSRVVTLWYRPPELLLGATEYGVAVDLWSTGCILAELLAGKPIMPGRTEVEQLHKIFKLCGSPSEEFWRNSKLPHATIFKPQHPYRRHVGEAFRDFPPSTLALLDQLLAIEPADRGTAASALASEFFTTKPFACDPSNLPKYPPSKEYDAKLRDEEARRQKAAAIKGHGSESGKTKAMPVPDPHTELQKRRLQANLKSSSGKYKPSEDTGFGFPVDLTRGKAENGFSHLSQSSTAVSSWGKKGYEGEARAVPGQSSTSLGQPNGPELKAQRSYLPHGGGSDLSNCSDLVAGKSSSTGLGSYRERVQPHRPEHRPSSRYNQLDVGDGCEKQEWAHHLLDPAASSRKKDNGIVSKESTMIYGVKKNRIHKSGPLMPAGGNMEEMLKEHERQIQQAVRKARLDKAKMKHYGEKGLSEALLYAGRNGRSDRVDIA